MAFSLQILVLLISSRMSFASQLAIRGTKHLYYYLLEEMDSSWKLTN